MTNENDTETIRYRLVKKGYSDVGDNVILVTFCWWQIKDVDDRIIMWLTFISNFRVQHVSMKIFDETENLAFWFLGYLDVGCWWQNMLMRFWWPLDYT